MKSGTGAWVQGYNGQVAVDTEAQVIVACELTNHAADAPHLAGMVDQVVQNTGLLPDELSADAGYFSAASVECLEQQGIEPLIPPDRERHGPPGATAEPLTPEEAAALPVAERQRNRVSTEAGRAGYSKRKKTVEPVIGQIKGCPAAPGFCAFLRRGLRKCSEEWHWACAVHNFKKYIRYQARQHGRFVPV